MSIMTHVVGETEYCDAMGCDIVPFPPHRGARPYVQHTLACYRVEKRVREEDRWIEQQFELAGGRPIEPEPKRPINAHDVIGASLIGVMYFGMVIRAYQLDGAVTLPWMLGLLLIPLGIFLWPRTKR